MPMLAPMPSASVTTAVSVNPGAATQRAQRKARVLHEVVEPRPSPGIPRLLPQAQGVPEGSRLFHQRTVRLHLSAQFVFQRTSSERESQDAESTHR